MLIATVAAGLDDPMGYGTVRIRNVHAGIGFVGDLGKAGRRPVRAGLSGSPHLEQLLAPLRARLDALDLADAGETALEIAPIERVATSGLELAASELRRCYASASSSRPERPRRSSSAWSDDGGNGERRRWSST